MAKTVDEIAKLAGVSVTSVRLVINGQDKKYRIGEKTRAKIQSIIDEHGYTINQTARSLKLQKTNTLGLVVPRLTNPFFSSLAEKLERDCRDAGYQLITVCSDDDDVIQRQVVKTLLARNVDGLFVTPSSAQEQKALEDNFNKPTICLDRDFGNTSIPVISTDNEAGGIIMGERLGKLNCELFFLGADYSLPTMQARLRGLTSGLMKNGYKLSDNEIIFQGRSDKENGYSIMESLCLRLGRIPQGIVTVSLPILSGVMAYLRKNHGHEYSEIIIGSFDDHSMLELCPNHMIAMKQNTTELSKMALHSMIRLINNEKVEDQFITITPEITERPAIQITKKTGD